MYMLSRQINMHQILKIQHGYCAIEARKKTCGYHGESYGKRHFTIFIKQICVGENCCFKIANMFFFLDRNKRKKELTVYSPTITINFSTDIEIM